MADSNKSSSNSNNSSNAQAESSKLMLVPEEITPVANSTDKETLRYAHSVSYVPSVVISTIEGTYPLVPRNYSHYLPNGAREDFIDDIISLQTQNLMSNDIPTCTITLGDQYDWSSVLSVNDLIRIDLVLPVGSSGNNDSLKPNVSLANKRWQLKTSGSGDNTTYSTEFEDTISYFQGDANTQVDSIKYNIYYGLISSLSRNTSYSSSQTTYTIVGQGMAKILSSIQLASFSELSANLSGYQMLPDDEKTGIAFGNHTSANIIKQIINRFILQNQSGSNTYDFESVNDNSYGIGITTRSTAVQVDWWGDLMGNAISEDTYSAYMDSIANNGGNS